MSKNYTKVHIEKLPARMVEITGEISAELMNSYRTKALKSLKAEVEMDGFRKGTAPEAMIIQKIGEMKILEEASQEALNAAYPEILEDENIDAIGRPEISITKLAPGIAMEFKIRTALTPELKLTNYKKIVKEFAKKKAEAREVEVTEKEIDEFILNLRKDVAHSKFHEEHGDDDDHSHGEFKDEDLPEVNEDFLKMIGGGTATFPTVEVLREKIRESVTQGKKAKAKDKHRTDILEKIITESTIELPEIIIQAELDKMVAQFKDDVARAGATYEGYLAHIKKTEEDIQKEWRETAEKRAKSLVVLSRIAEEEKLAPAEEDIKREMDKVLAQDASLDRFRVRMFVESFLSNDMVFAFLENGEEKEEKGE